MPDQKITLSWDEVSALFPDLPEDASLVDIMMYRGHPARVEFNFAVPEESVKKNKKKDSE